MEINLHYKVENMSWLDIDNEIEKSNEDPEVICVDDRN